MLVQTFKCRKCISENSSNQNKLTNRTCPHQMFDHQMFKLRSVFHHIQPILPNLNNRLPNHELNMFVQTPTAEYPMRGLNQPKRISRTNSSSSDTEHVTFHNSTRYFPSSSSRYLKQTRWVRHNPPHTFPIPRTSTRYAPMPYYIPKNRTNFTSHSKL